jgi:hypothetical protein
MEQRPMKKEKREKEKKRKREKEKKRKREKEKKRLKPLTFFSVRHCEKFNPNMNM